MYVAKVARGTETADDALPTLSALLMDFRRCPDLVKASPSHGSCGSAHGRPSGLPRSNVQGESVFAAGWRIAEHPPAMYVDEVLQDCGPVWDELEFERRLYDAVLEAQERGFVEPTDDVLRSCWSLWHRMFRERAARYDVYPEWDGEVTIDVRDHKGCIVTATVEPGGGVLCILVDGDWSDDARYAGPAGLPDGKLSGWLSRLDLGD